MTQAKVTKGLDGDYFAAIMCCSLCNLLPSGVHGLSEADSCYDFPGSSP